MLKTKFEKKVQLEEKFYHKNWLGKWIFSKKDIFM